MLLCGALCLLGAHFRLLRAQILLRRRVQELVEQVEVVARSEGLEQVSELEAEGPAQVIVRLVP